MYHLSLDIYYLSIQVYSDSRPSTVKNTSSGPSTVPNAAVPEAVVALLVRGGLPSPLQVALHPF